MTQPKRGCRLHKISRDGQVEAAVAFDENNKASIALAKTAKFEDLLEALVVVDPGMQQMVDETMPQALEMIEAGAPVDTPADRQRLYERAKRANRRERYSVSKKDRAAGGGLSTDLGRAARADSGRAGHDARVARQGSDGADRGSEGGVRRNGAVGVTRSELPRDRGRHSREFACAHTTLLALLSYNQWA